MERYVQSTHKSYWKKYIEEKKAATRIVEVPSAKKMKQYTMTDFHPGMAVTSNLKMTYQQIENACVHLVTHNG